MTNKVVSSVKPKFKVGDQVRRLDAVTHKWSRGTVVRISLSYPLTYIIYDHKRGHEYGASTFHVRAERKSK
jgi:hypothetical protein